MDEQHYWAALPRESEGYFQAIQERWQTHMEAYSESYLFQTTRRALADYHNCDAATGQRYTDHLRPLDDGTVVIDVPRFREILDKKIAATVSEFTGWEPQPANSDSESLKANRIGRRVLRVYSEKEDLPRFVTTYAEIAWVYGIAWAVPYWDPEAGEQSLTASGALAYEGDIRLDVVPPDRCAWDRDDDNPDRPRWFMVLRRMNRWDMAATYPRAKKKILGSPGRFFSVADELYPGRRLEYTGARDDNDDYIEVMEVLIDRRRALPHGRRTLVLADGTFLEDRHGRLKTGDPVGLDYPSLPAFRLAQAEDLQERWPYALSHTLLSPCELYRAAEGTYASRFLHRTDVLVVPENANYEPNDLESRDIVRANAQDAPREIRWGGADKSDKDAIEHWLELTDRLGNISDAQYGQRGGDSGKHEEVLLAASAGYSKNFAERFRGVMGRIGAFILQTLAMKATGKRVACTAGKNVLVRGSSGGHLQLAMKLAHAGLIKDVEQLARFATEGLAQQVDEDAEEREIRVRRENEWIMTGEGPEPVVTPGEDHAGEAVQHLAALETNESRYDPDAVRRGLGHIEEHLSALEPDNPELARNIYYLLVTNQKPFPRREELLPRNPDGGARPMGSAPVPGEQAAPVGAAGVAGAPGGSPQGVSAPGAAEAGAQATGGTPPTPPGAPGGQAPQPTEGGGEL